MLIPIEVVGKNQPESGLESMGDAPVLSHCSLLRNPGRKQTGVLEHCREGEKHLHISDSIPKATKDVTVHFFNYGRNYCKLFQRIEAATLF
jgi:hypothetical protein